MATPMLALTEIPHLSQLSGLLKLFWTETDASVMLYYLICRIRILVKMIKRNLSELMYDLELDESMIKSILRIGRPSTKVRPLRIQLSSESSRNTFLDAAYLLKFMRRKWPKLGISPDRPPHEMETHRSLMQEFRERRSQGENIHLAGDKIVQNTKKNLTSK